MAGFTFIAGVVDGTIRNMNNGANGNSRASFAVNTEEGVHYVIVCHAKPLIDKAQRVADGDQVVVMGVPQGREIRAETMFYVCDKDNCPDCDTTKA